MAAYQCCDQLHSLQATEDTNLLLLLAQSDNTVLKSTGNYFTVLCFDVNSQQISLMIGLLIFHKFSRQITPCVSNDRRAKTCLKIIN